MEGITLDLGQLKGIKLPDLRATIDYCKLHETTRDENYRKLAIDEFRSYEGLVGGFNLIIPKMVKEFYPILAENFGLNEEDLSQNDLEVKKGIENLVEELSESINSQDAIKWRDYCIGCKTPSSKACSPKREKLIAFQGRNVEKAERCIEDVTELIKLILKYGSFSSTNFSQFRKRKFNS